MGQIIFISLLFIAALCVVKISIADWRRRIIPDVWLWPLMLVGLIMVTMFPWIITPADAVIAATFGYGLAFGIGYIFNKIKNKPIHDSIGLGDIKLLGVGGIWLGGTGLAIAIVISCIVGGIWGVVKRQKYIPFAPFFFIGAIIALITLWLLI